MNLLKASALAAYALTSWIFIYILSTNDYEWMIGEKDTDGSAMTFCSLPLQNDDYSDIAPLMMIVFVSMVSSWASGICCGKRILSPIWQLDRALFCLQPIVFLDEPPVLMGRNVAAMHLRCSADLSLVVADRQRLLYIDGARWFNYIACNKLTSGDHRVGGTKVGSKLASMSANTRDTPDEAEEAEAPHYHGHRMRLRERFHGAGPDALSDYELLEMVLFSARARGDVKPLAKMLIKTFGSSPRSCTRRKRGCAKSMGWATRRSRS